MGVPKAGVELATGRTMFDHVISNARSLNLPCVAAGHAGGINLPDFPGMEVIPDEVAARGPVGALLGLFKSNRAHHYLIIACDQPLLNPEILSLLLTDFDQRPNVFIHPIDGRVSPLPGLYPASLLPLVKQLLHQPRASLRELLAAADSRTIILDRREWYRLRSANSPQDVEEINNLLRSTV